MTDQPIPLKPRKSRAACPICGRPPAPEAKPFCSPRCADVDLGRWLNESYRVPVTEETDEDGETAPGVERD
ncbi:DNA gyrase inhibitor YacG [Nitrospirillum viridazoti]|uniref:DNA gyrase inhibitor YacG n=1 Tax=Nitrospirillum viridazoti CBAmc TaxID=1441467 RepID=A0A248JV81_9PROT|nr:DNA gyrase inhibitor YacG [Nitrospirillum amazonense]ASG22627.1 DNA gyrase inhibitor YacG [Nitrospirillum amazonense CBAmc]TWB42802.1 hypothetical protein FBZ91_10217 [Nitrospirillum amazonense]